MASYFEEIKVLIFAFKSLGDFIVVALNESYFITHMVIKNGDEHVLVSLINGCQ